LSTLGESPTASPVLEANFVRPSKHRTANRAIYCRHTCPRWSSLLRLKTSTSSRVNRVLETMMPIIPTQVHVSTPLRPRATLLTSYALCLPESEISTDSDFDPSSETLADRFYALRDIVPPTTRGWLHGRYQLGSRLVRTGFTFLGRSAWAISVSALLVGIPFALCWAEEQNMIAMEQEQRMREMGGELLTAGGDKGEGATASQVSAALAGATAKPAL